MSLWLGLVLSLQSVSELRVEGNRHTSTETILEYASIEDDDDLTAAFRRLWASGLFEDLRFEREDGTLVIHVSEKPLLAAYRFEGDQLPVNDLVVVLELRRNRPFGEDERHRAERTAEALLGTDFEVRAEVSPAATGVDLLLIVERVERPKLESIFFRGNEALSDKQIRSVMHLRGSGWTTWATKRDRFSESVLEDDLEAIRALYRRHGFVDVRVGPVASGDSLIIPIREGRPYRLDALDVEPGPLLSSEDVRAWLPGTGETFDEIAIDAVVARMERFYRARGHPAVTVIREQNVIAPGSLAVSLRVNEGTLYHVGRIGFRGNTRHRDRDLRQHLNLTETELFDQTKLESGVIAVSRLESVSDAVPEVDFTSRPGHADVTYRIREVDRFEYLVGGGVNGVQGGSANGQFIVRSLLGRGDVWRFDGDLGNRFQNIAFGYRDPSTIGRRLFLMFDFARTDLLFPDQTSEDSMSFAARVGGPQGSKVQFLAGVEGARFRLDSQLDDDVPFLTPFLGQTFRTLRLNSSIVYDDRNAPFLARRGRAFRAEAEIVTGDVDAFRASTRLSQLFSFETRHIVTLSGRLEAVWPFGETPTTGLPRFERLFLGSENDMRGFAIRGVGPRSGDVTVGGDRLVFASAEYRFALHPRLHVGGFFDVGNVFATDFEGPPLPTLRYDAGPELQWFLPLGNVPFRLGYGFNLDRVLGEDPGRFFATLSIRF